MAPRNNSTRKTIRKRKPVKKASISKAIKELEDGPKPIIRVKVTAIYPGPNGEIDLSDLSETSSSEDDDNDE